MSNMPLTFVDIHVHYRRDHLAHVIILFLIRTDRVLYSPIRKT